MTAGTQSIGPPALGIFERWLTLWVFLCIVAGILFGQLSPHLFAPLLPAEQIDSYIAGLILLAAAPCTAMVFIWSRLTGGDPYFTLSQVALNDTIMVFAFAPIVALLLGVASIAVPVMLLVVKIVNASKEWYEMRALPRAAP